MPKKDTVSPDGAKIRRLRQGLGLTREEFAEKAECSTRSMSNAESGRNVEVATLKCIADAFQVPPSELILGGSTPPSPNLFRLQLVIEADMDKLNQSHALESFTSLLRELISAQGEVAIRDIRQGSVIVTLEMQEQDALELVAIMPNFLDFARDTIRERIESHIRRTPDFQRQLIQSVARKPDGRYYTSARVTEFIEATFFLARQTDQLRLIEGVKQLRVPVGRQRREGDTLTDTVPDREEWEINPDILRMAGYPTDVSRSE